MLYSLDIQLFGGRGSKSSRSKKFMYNGVQYQNAGQVAYAKYQQSVSQLPPIDVVQAQAPTQQVGNLGKTLSDVQSMSDDELHDYIIAVNGQDMPAMMNNTHMQKFVYATGVNAKPQIVDDATFDQMTKGKGIIYRTVNDANGLTATEIHQMTQSSRLSYMGNGLLGDGLYFAKDRWDSEGYGNRTAKVMRTTLNSNARVIDIGALRNDYDSWKVTHPKARKAFGFASTKGSSWNNSYGQYALYRGYNVITNGTGYYNVLDRSAMTISKSIKNKGENW